MEQVKNILIIDDDNVYRYTTEKYLKLLKLSKEVTVYSDAEEALGYLEANLNNKNIFPEIILLDVNMPILDGWQFIAEFQKLKGQLDQKLDLYMVSSSIDERDEFRAKSLEGVKDFLVKPLNEAGMRKMVEDYQY